MRFIHTLNIVYPRLCFEFGVSFMIFFVWFYIIAIFYSSPETTDEYLK